MNFRKSVIKNSVQLILKSTAWLAQREKMDRVTLIVMTAMARAVVLIKGIKKTDDLPELGRQWQKAFPSAKQVPIVNTTENTILAEIHTRCPLRGTGDVHACYKMMKYDREVVKKSGGQFIVLKSQATPGNTFCTVAIRKNSSDISDLAPAHAKQRITKR